MLKDTTRPEIILFFSRVWLAIVGDSALEGSLFLLENGSLYCGPFVLDVRRLFSGLDSTRFLYFSAATGPRGEVLDVVQGAVNPVHWGINPG